MSTALEIPRELLPRDGRFGSGPSKVRDEQIAAIAAAQPHVMGTSHRQAPVKNLVGDVRRMLADLYSLPEGYEVILGNGGSTSFWDAAAFSLVERRAQHCSFGEFGSKFATATTTAPHLEESEVRTASAGSVALPQASDGIDVYAWPHNETSTGAMAPVIRPDGIGDALTVVDGTSAAGGLFLDASHADVYYFAPQKSFGSDGGIWFALVSPAAFERIERIAATDRYIPATLHLQTAVDNSRKDQTYNTPALAPLVMMRNQVEWMLEHGGMDFVTGRTQESSRRLYEWAEASSLVQPFVTEVEYRSHVVTTIDIDDSIDAAAVTRVLRSHGVVDIDPYRKLGRNQVRVGVFPAVDPDDVTALTRCLDYVMDRLQS